MRNPKESHRVIRQNDQTVKKSQKHETNLQKNSTLYFQVGLIVCLLATYAMFEMKFETKVPPPIEYDGYDADDLYVFNEIVKPEEVKKEEVKKRPQKVLKNPVISEEDPPNAELPEVLDPPPSEPSFNPNSLPSLPKEPEDEPMVDFIRVEQVPVFPGCEKKKGREAQSKCMSNKIDKLIQKKFNVDLADEIGLSGVQKIDVQFKIDKEGKVTVIKTRAPHPLLEKEAKRVIELIPDMQPGKQRDRPVEVRFFKPIRFQVHN